MRTFNFSANGLDFGNYSGVDQKHAQEAFALDSGYESWRAMVEQAEEMSEAGNTVEVYEIEEG